jgi:RHS repeat-associated protein
LRLLLIAVAALLVPRTGRAQGGCLGIGCPPNEPPTIRITPFSQTFSSPQVTVTVYVTDDRSIYYPSFHFYINGVDQNWSLPQTSATGAMGTFQLTLPSGTSTVSATISDWDGASASDNDTYTYTPPPPPPSRDAPTLSIAFHAQSFRDVMCGTCTNATLSYSTPAYTSLDVARSMTLTYSSARAVPMGFVQIDANMNVSETPEKLELTLWRPDNAQQALTNGVPQAQFAGAIGTSRVAAQFDARNSGGTGTRNFVAEVGGSWAGGSDYRHANVAVRTLIIDDSYSAYGWGWSIAGLQRLVPVADSLMLVDGSGEAAFFPRCGANCWTSPPGDYSVLSFDGTNYHRTLRDGTVATFSGSGYLLNVTDRFGSATQYQYNGANLVTITDPAGQATSLRYAPDASCTLGGKTATLCSITTPGGRVTQLYVDSNGDLTRIDDPDGTTALTATYNGHLLAHWTNRAIAASDVTYDQFYQLALAIGPQVSTNVGNVRDTTRIRSVELASLAPVGSNYNPRPRVLPDSATAVDTLPKGTIMNVLPYRTGKPLRIEARDPIGHVQVSKFVYDTANRLVQQISPTGGSMTYSWFNGTLTDIKDDVAGTDTQFGYTSYDQIERVWLNGLLIEQYFFSGAQKAPDSVRANNFATPSLNEFTRWSYDSRGRVLTTTDPESHQFSTSYFATGFQNTQSSTAAGVTTTFGYDSYGRLQTATDPLNHVYTTNYDALNRATSVTAPYSTTISTNYNDPAGTKLVTDPLSQHYTTVSNTAGWVVAQIDPNNRADSLFYDKHGNVVRVKDRNADSVTYTYDLLDRVLTRTANGLVTTYSYDPAWPSLWTAVGNAESQDTVFTDADGRVVRTVSARNGSGYEVATGYRNDGMQGSLMIQRRDEPSQAMVWGPFTLTFDYDTLLRVKSLPDFAGKMTSVTYNRDDLPSVITLPTGSNAAQHLQATYSYGLTHALSQVSFNQNLDPFVGRTYIRNALDQIDSRFSGAWGDRYYRDFGYDDLGRLTSYNDHHYWIEEVWVCPDPYQEDCPDGYWDEIPHDDPIRNDSYSYDAVGNRTDRAHVYATGNRATSFDGWAMTYDHVGNMLSKSKGSTAYTYKWDALGQLDTVIANGVTTTYGYDGFGRRIRKTVNGVTTRYIYDGDNIVAELDASGNLVREYSYYAGVDQPHAMRQQSNGAVYYYTTQEAGHVATLVNSSNSVVNTYQFDAFGIPISISETVQQPFRFAGREFDAETGLSYMRARYYDPQLGRFISEDPIGVAGGINQYTYSGNDPVNARDPYGLMTICYLIVGQTDMDVPGGVGVLGFSFPVCVDDGSGPDGGEPDYPDFPPPDGPPPPGGNPAQQQKDCGKLDAKDCKRVKSAISAIRKNKKKNKDCAAVANTLSTALKSGNIQRQPDYEFPGKNASSPGSCEYGTFTSSTGMIGINDITFRGGRCPNGNKAPPLREVLGHEGYHGTFPESNKSGNDVPGKPVYTVGSGVCGS